MNPEYGVLARDFYVSVLEIECLVAGRRLFDIAFSDVLARFGGGPVGHGGDAQCGGRYPGDSVVCKRVGRMLWHVMQRREGFGTVEDGKRGTNIDRDMEISRGESDGSSNFGRDFIAYRVPFSFSLRLLNLSDIPLFFLFPLQPCSMVLAKFLVTN